MDFDKVLKKRTSVRRYSSKKVDVSSLTAVCEAARFIPVAGNIYTAKLIIVSDKKKKEEITEAALGQSFISDAPYVIVVCSDLSVLKKSYGSIENMLLKITELELASCWVGAFDENAIKRILKIPDHIQIEAILPLANPFGKEKAKKKPDLNMIVYFEKWGQRTAKPIRKLYA